MPVFIYAGRLPNGRAIQGEVIADDKDSALSNLRRKSIIVESIRKKPKEFQLGFKRGKVSNNDLVLFARQFSTMIDAGLPIIKCLGILSEQIKNKNFKSILINVTESVEAGSSLAEALKKHPNVFNELFVHMVEVGEVGGILDVVLRRLASYLEKAAALRRKVRGAMVYPVMVLSVATLAVSFLLIFVVPTFSRVFLEFGGELPAPTKVVIAISKFLRGNILFIIIAIIVGIFLFSRYYKTSAGRLSVDKFLLSLPVFGPLIQKTVIARFSRTLGTLIKSGVPILYALDVTSKTAGNRVIQNAILKSKERIAAGQNISDPLRETAVFPPMVVEMISVGEKSGALDSMLDKIADFYDEQVDQAVSNLTAAMEPMIIIFLGVIVGGIMVAMYMPMFTIVTIIK